MEAYEIIKSEAESPNDGLSRDRAKALVRAHQEFQAEPADTEYAIERLIDYGWLYEVEGELRITDPES